MTSLGHSHLSGFSSNRDLVAVDGFEPSELTRYERAPVSRPYCELVVPIGLEPM